MNDAKLLTEGIAALRQNDEDIERLIAPRAEEVLSLLIRYISEIELFNEAYGLVGANNGEELVVKHILDSLAPLGIICRLLGNGTTGDSKVETGAAADSEVAAPPVDKPPVGKPMIADAGSGAGLPGIPLAIAMPNFDFTLIERMGRRAGFLWNTKANLGLSNIAVEEGELEKTAPGRFRLVTFRAFKPLDSRLLKTLFKACENGGVIAAYKGRLEKIEQEMSQTLGSQKTSRGGAEAQRREDACFSKDLVWEAIPYSVPFLAEERHIVVIKKP